MITLSKFLIVSHFRSIALCLLQPAAIKVIFNGKDLTETLCFLDKIFIGLNTGILLTWLWTGSYELGNWSGKKVCRKLLLLSLYSWNEMSSEQKKELECCYQRVVWSPGAYHHLHYQEEEKSHIFFLQKFNTPKISWPFITIIHKCLPVL